MNTITIIDQEGNQFICKDVGSMEGFEYPTTRVSIDDVAGDRSSVYITSKFGRRPLSWQGVIEAQFLSKRRDLQTALRQGGLKTIKFTTCDGLALQAEIEINKLLMPYKVARPKYMIDAVAPDYRFYSQTLHSSTTAPTTILGGFGIPAAIPLDMSGGVGSIAGDVIDNQGTEETDPTFTINGPGTQFTITNTTTGDELIIEYTLTASEFIEVDVQNRQIYLNGVTEIYSSLTSGDFFTLDPGENNIGFLVIGSGAETELTTEWRDAFLGV